VKLSQHRIWNKPSLPLFFRAHNTSVDLVQVFCELEKGENKLCRNCSCIFQRPDLGFFLSHLADFEKGRDGFLDFQKTEIKINPKIKIAKIKI